MSISLFVLRMIAGRVQGSKRVRMNLENIYF